MNASTSESPSRPCRCDVPHDGVCASFCCHKPAALIFVHQPTTWETDSVNATKTAANGPNREGTSRNLASISPFFIVKDLQVSISHYIERFGFELDFQGPDDRRPYYAGVRRDDIGIMLKAILPDVLPQPNHTRHEWARWDAYIITLDPDALFDEFSQRGASFVKELSFIDEGLWGFEVTDADGYVLAFFRLRRD
jgi:hypothetical protein